MHLRHDTFAGRSRHWRAAARGKYKAVLWNAPITRACDFAQRLQDLATHRAGVAPRSHHFCVASDVSSVFGGLVTGTYGARIRILEVFLGVQTGQPTQVAWLGGLRPTPVVQQHIHLFRGEVSRCLNTAPLPGCAYPPRCDINLAGATWTPKMTISLQNKTAVPRPIGTSSGSDMAPWWHPRKSDPEIVAGGEPRRTSVSAPYTRCIGARPCSGLGRDP
eukprot:gene22487-biopygen19255